MSSLSDSMMHISSLITPNFILLQCFINQVLKINIGILKIVSRTNQEKPNPAWTIAGQFYGYVLKALDQW